MTLVARTRHLDLKPDLVRVAGADGFVVPGTTPGTGMAGFGVARVVEIDTADPSAADVVARVLRAIATDDEVGRAGTGAVAIGALPFVPGQPATMAVPAFVVGVDQDGAWVTTIGAGAEVTDTDDMVRERLSAPVPPTPDGFHLSSTVPHDRWCAVVEDALNDIDRGRLTKVVLAREVRVEANRPIPVVTVLERLRALYPSCHHFSIDGFVGASPELLVSRIGDAVRSHPLAGTLAHSGDARADTEAAASLLGSVKDRWEHGLVVQAVASALAPHCAALDVPEAPSIVSLRNVMHLGTEITGELRDDTSALALALALHPTPAVGGTPTEEAIAWIGTSEGIDRGRYAGPVGWVDARGDGLFVVGIRSAQIDGTVARLFAGVGVVAGSEPEAELAETQLKLQALLAALVRP